MPHDRTGLFLTLYCATIALQTAVHFREQFRFFRTQPARLYGPPPHLLGWIKLPAPGERIFLFAGVAFILALGAAADGVAPRLTLGVGLFAYFFYFPAILGLGYVQRKSNLIPIVLFSLLFAPAYALWLVKTSLSLIYLSAGIEKLRSSGVRWADGRSFQAYLIEHYLYTENPSARWLAGRPQLCRVLAGLVLVWELSFVLILGFPRLEPLYALVGLGLHAGTSITMRIHYWIYFCPAYFVFLTPWLCTHI